jgi:hypothetical protein
MVAALVSYGALEASLVYDTCQEMYFQYAKVQPYWAELRKKMNLPEFLISIDRLVEGSEAGRRRVQTMRTNLSVMAEVRGRSKPPEGQPLDQHPQLINKRCKPSKVWRSIKLTLPIAC